MGFLSTLATFTNVLNSYKSLIVILFYCSIPFSYIICLLVNINRLSNRNYKINKQNKKLKRKIKHKSQQLNDVRINNKGLKNQLVIYKEEIKNQNNVIEQLSLDITYRIIEKVLIISEIPNDKLTNVKKRMDILKGNTLNEKNESSKDN